MKIYFYTGIDANGKQITSQILAKNKSEQRIKKILAILLDMEESQITLVCENEKVLAKRVKEAEGILNDDHWTKRVRKVTLGE